MNSVVITTRPSQENIVTSITIANSLVIITSFTGKQLSLAFGDWYKTWHVSRVCPLCLQTGHNQRVWLSSSLPPPHFYYVFVIRHFAFFLVPSRLQELNNYNSLLRYFMKVKSEHCSKFFQFKQLETRSVKKIRASTRFEPVTSAIPVRYSTNWAMKPHLAPNVWLHSTVGRASHRYREGHRFAALKPWFFFSGFLFPIA